jgi:lipid-binding SYLF domain-containing protein
MSLRSSLAAIAAALLLFSGSAGWAPARAASAADLEAAAQATLDRLRASEPVTDKMISEAAGILIFPEIVRAGLLVGASGGEGVLTAGGKTLGYFRTVSASFGLQAGISAYGYVMFLMDQKALDFVRETKGWEVGVGPNVTVADRGVARRLSTTTVREGIYVFFVDQKGLFAGAGIEGSKITPIAR